MYGAGAGAGGGQGGEVIVFNFMADVKERLEKLRPDALVTVEPWEHAGVIVRVWWKMGGRKAEVGRLVSVGEISERPGIAEYYVEEIVLQIITEEENAKGSSPA